MTGRVGDERTSDSMRSQTQRERRIATPIASVWLFMAVILAPLAQSVSTQSVAEGRFASLVITTSTGAVTIADAQISVDIGEPPRSPLSPRVYYLNGPPANWQVVTGLTVTDAVVVPAGFSMDQDEIPFVSLRDISFLEWDVEIGERHYTKARLTRLDGSSRECFVWVGGNRRDVRLGQTDIRIAGQLLVNGSRRGGITFTGADGIVLKQIAFSTLRQGR